MMQNDQEALDTRASTSRRVAMPRFFIGVVVGIVATLVALTLTIWLWPWDVKAVSVPSALETSVMRDLLSRGIDREARPAAVPLPASEANLRAGLKIFRMNCAGCHGDSTSPSLWGTTAFLPRVPQFATQPPDWKIWQIRWIVKNGLRNTAMGAWAPLMSNEQIWQVSLFLSRLGSLPPDVAAEWRRSQS
jgi:mono/diheme cytochrome c family protein